MAQKEVYLATRYHDPHFSKIMFKKISEGITFHFLDSLPDQISVENRLSAVLRVPPDRESFEIVSALIKSPKFDLRRSNLNVSFMVVDGVSVCYETNNFTNPEQFTLAISHYDDPYLAQRFIDYYNTLAKDAPVPKLMQEIRGK